MVTVKKMATKAAAAKTPAGPQTSRILRAHCFITPFTLYVVY